MCPSNKPTCSHGALWKLGLPILVLLLPLLVLSCTSTKQLAQELEENQGNFLTPLPAVPVSQAAATAPAQPAVAPVAQLADTPADKPAAQETKQAAPLKVCSVVPEEDLQDMVGCLGVYFFNYIFDIDLVNNPQVQVSTNFEAILPDGSPPPSGNSMTASYKDNNVSYTAGILGSGIGSSVVVTGQNITVFSNAEFNFKLPDTSVLIPSINVLPAATLSGVGK